MKKSPLFTKGLMQVGPWENPEGNRSRRPVGARNSVLTKAFRMGFF